MKRLLVVAPLFVYATSSLLAQTITGSVTGTVTDPTGAVVPNATVTATNVQTGVSTPTQTNSQGIYNIRFLQIGRYKVTTEASGFSRQTTAEFGLEVQQEARIDVKVSTGSDVQTITVTDTAPIINTEDPTTGATITAAQATELPLQARNFSSLTTLVAGAVATAPANANNVGRPTYNSGFFVNGNREQSNNYTLDGVDINDAIDNYINYSPNVDAIGELHIISGNATAEYGNANGGQVVMVTKSGTNSLHGNAFWFLENTKLNANSWANKHTPDLASRGPVPDLNRSIFGGTLGGPVIKDRLFFFVDYQGARQHNNTTQFDSVATLAMRQGISPTGVQYTISNPAARYLFSHPELYPLPNVNVPANVYVNNHVGTHSNATTNNQGDIKVDGKLTAKDNLSGRFTIGRENDGDSRVALPISLGTANVSPYTGFSVNWTHVISQNIVNEARAGFSRGRFINLVSDPSGLIGLGGNSALGIPGTQIAPGISALNIQNYSLSKIGSEGVQNDSLTNAFTYGDAVSWQRGRHSLKFGVTAIRYQSNRNYSGNDGVLGHFDYDGTATGDAFGDFLTNQSAAFGQGSYTAKWGQRQWRDALYFQDDWKVTPNLTINLGLRWEYDQPLYESHNKESNVDITTGAVTIAGQNGASRALYNSYWYGYMPRVGFAYAPEVFNGKFSLRGGYGITNFLEGTGANLRLTLNPPFFSNAAGTRSGSNYFAAQNGFPLPTNTSTFSGNIRAWDPKLRPALIQQFNLSTETQLDRNTSLGIAYLGQSGNHLVDPRDPNQQHCLTCARPVSSLPGLTLVSQVSYTESRSMMNYNSLQVSGRRRLTNGLEFLTNYTYSKGLTNNLGYYGGSGTASQSAYWQDAYNGSADYGPAFFDATHIFTFGGYYELPFGRGRLFGSHMNRVVDEAVGGWKLGVTSILHTGFPITISSPGNYNVNQRANRGNRYRALHITNRSVDHWFGTDPSATVCGLSDNGVCAYGQESTNGFGTASVGSERAPSYKNVDANLSKAFAITEGSNLQFRANFYNVLNTVSLAPPDASSSSTTFGLINGTNSTERQIELALKLTF
ncbi:MAG: carboxypeptidase regulatory-like domain-containing protein [Janthinobacterium lividum]